MGGHHQKEIVIIGAGVASLSCANRLVDRGIRPLIVDAQELPQHRVCGEFLSPESLPILRTWNLIPPCEVSYCVFRMGQRELRFPLEPPAGSWSRYDLDLQMLRRAEAHGAEVLLGTRVEEWKREAGRWKLHLTGGEEVWADHLAVGTGRLSGEPSPARYLGFKAHFSGRLPDPCLSMFLIPGGYVGVCPVGSDVLNVAGVVSLGEGPEKDQVDRLFSHPNLSFLAHNIVRPGSMLFPDWMTVRAPVFGLKAPPDLPNVLWIGDAAGSVPPICGGGLSLGIQGGVMAADYLAEGRAAQFRPHWERRFRRCFQVGSMLHYSVMHPVLKVPLFNLCRGWSYLPKTLFSWTRPHH